MISLDPAARPTFDTLLHMSRGSVFPESFYSFLHNYVSSLNDISTCQPSSTPSPPSTATTTNSRAVPSISGSTVRPSSSLGHASDPPVDATPEASPNASDYRLEKLWADYESIEPSLVTETQDETVSNIKIEYAATPTVSKPFQVCPFSNSQSSPEWPFY